MSFRSHLMQQFAAAARQQSRPPLALAPLYGDGNSTASPQRRSTRRSTSSDASPSLSRRGPSTVSSLRQTVQSSPRHTPNGGYIRVAGRSDEQQGALGTSRSLSKVTATSLAAAEDNGEDATATSQNHDAPIIEPPPIPELQQSFQHMLKTRRTVSNFLHNSEPSSAAHLSAAISRAVHCAVEAPNHKRTEPYTFTRLVSPSATTEALANVCYHVSVRRMREKQKGSEKTLLTEAERKRDRWRSIPAFLVASVGGMPDQIPSEAHALSQEEGSEYAQLPFVLPQTELQLENYASSCAATQNVLLSLHSEQLGSKWATGPVIRTKAFRDVVQLRNDELVVGLIMVGVPKRVPRSPRKRRTLEGDVLKDI
jgi:nitroreductase